MKQLTFTLTEQEAQTILDCLTEHPYRVVAGVIAAMQSQAAEQIEAPNPEQ